MVGKFSVPAGPGVRFQVGLRPDHQYTSVRVFFPRLPSGQFLHLCPGLLLPFQHGRPGVGCYDVRAPLGEIPTPVAGARSHVQQRPQGPDGLQGPGVRDGEAELHDVLVSDRLFRPGVVFIALLVRRPGGLVGRFPGHAEDPVLGPGGPGARERLAMQPGGVQDGAAGAASPGAHRCVPEVEDFFLFPPFGVAHLSSSLLANSRKASSLNSGGLASME